jgi:hypothetical protein
MLRLHLALSALLLLSLNSVSFAQPAGSQMLRLNGSSTYVNCGTINLSGSAVTIQGWLRVQAFKSSFPYISSFAGTEMTGSQCAVRIGDASIPNNRVQFVLYIGGQFYKLHTATALTTNQWYHIAATYDGAAMKIYLNGVLDTTMAQTGLITSNNTFEIGRNYGNDRILQGDLDEISVFNTALNQAAIRSWMCRRIDATHPYYPNLIGYWPMDEGSGSTTIDHSPNGYDGTLVSSPLWKNSGAPVGDESVFVYGSTFNIGLAHPDGDSLHVTSTSGTFSGVHIYRVDSVPYVTDAPSPLNYLDTTRHWGVFPILSANYQVDYFYNGNAAANNVDCNLSFATRADGNASTWQNQTPDTVNYPGQVLSFAASGRKEIIMAISNNGPHTLSFDVSEPLCNGDNNGQVTLSVSGGLAPYTYDWQTGSTSASSGNVSAGYVHVTVTDDNGCETADSVLVGEPIAMGFFSNVTNSVCSDTNTGSATAIPTGGVAPYSYQWNDPNNSLTQTAGSLFPGTYSVTVTDLNGCTLIDQVSVGSTGPDPLPSLGSDTNVCNGITFGLVPAGGPYASYLWSDGFTGGIKVINAAGTYAVTVENAQGCSGSDTVVIDYVAPVQVNLGANNQSAVGSLVLDAGAGFLTYQWSTQASSQSITVTQSAAYWVKTTDQNHCKTSDTVNVTITASGLSALDEWGWRAYPNPAVDYIEIEAPQHLVGQAYAIMDLSGRQIGQGVLDASTLLDVSAFPSGAYFILIQDAERTHAVRITKL